MVCDSRKGEREGESGGRATRNRSTMGRNGEESSPPRGWWRRSINITPHCHLRLNPNPDRRSPLLPPSLSPSLRPSAPDPLLSARKNNLRLRIPGQRGRRALLSFPPHARRRLIFAGISDFRRANTIGKAESMPRRAY